MLKNICGQSLKSFAATLVLGSHYVVRDKQTGVFAGRTFTDRVAFTNAQGKEIRGYPSEIRKANVGEVNAYLNATRSIYPPETTLNTVTLDRQESGC